jgi:hypothetical protein
MTCGAESKAGPAKYNGYLLMNGIYGKVNANGVEVVRLNHGDRLVCFGPNRMGINDKHYVVGWKAMAANTVSTNKYFTQNFFNEDTSDTLYRYTVGTFVDATGMVMIEVYIKNATTYTLLTLIAKAFLFIIIKAFFIPKATAKTRNGITTILVIRSLVLNNTLSNIPATAIEVISFFIQYLY